jgi:hypothetical protein
MESWVGEGMGQLKKYGELVKRRNGSTEKGMESWVGEGMGQLKKYGVYIYTHFPSSLFVLIKIGAAQRFPGWQIVDPIEGGVQITIQNS